MNLVDSSGWLEFFIDGKNADQFKKPLDNTDNLIVPTICLYEVFKVVLRERGLDSALQAIALMKQGQVIDLSSEIAIRAANISHHKNIPMADSIILATAENSQAIIWTQDIDFKDQQNVKYFPK
ncbi:PIN domain-containing protein [candidate division KSB1 bacterium]|nr:PIN domain-containing protein [candidate division KSB1 bacterium]